MYQHCTQFFLPQSESTRYPAWCRTHCWGVNLNLYEDEAWTKLHREISWVLLIPALFSRKMWDGIPMMRQDLCDLLVFVLGDVYPFAATGSFSGMPNRLSKAQTDHDRRAWRVLMWLVYHHDVLCIFACGRDPVTTPGRIISASWGASRRFEIALKEPTVVNTADV